MTNDTSNVFKLAALQDSDAELIEELAGLSTLDYDRRRKEAAKELNVGVAALDKVVAKERKRLGLDEEQSPAAVSLRSSRPRIRCRPPVCFTGLPPGSSSMSCFPTRRQMRWRFGWPLPGRMTRPRTRPCCW